MNACMGNVEPYAMYMYSILNITKMYKCVRGKCAAVHSIWKISKAYVFMLENVEAEVQVYSMFTRCMNACMGNVEPCILNICKVYELVHGNCGGVR